MNDRTFKPFDDGTVSLNVSASSDRVDFTSRHNGSTARIANRGDDWIFIKFGGSDVVANENDIPIPPNWCEVFAVPNDTTHCAAVSDASPATSMLYITPGDGD